MTCPFPGMDPYIEVMGLWEGFHAPLITNCSQYLNQHLSEGYVAQVETRVKTVAIAYPERERVPDVLIGREPGAPAFFGPASGGSVATLEPIDAPLAMGEVEVRERWIEIKRLPDLELVTVIEFLSPTNKAGAGRDEYLEKLTSLLDQSVHVVEIDLLLGVRPTPLARPLPPYHYRALIARADRRPDAQVYALTIRQPLPTLPIPLRAPDADVMLPLGETFEMTYRLGRFNRLVRHDGPLPEGISLSPDDHRWAEGMGRRTDP